MQNLRPLRLNRTIRHMTHIVVVIIALTSLLLPIACQPKLTIIGEVDLKNIVDWNDVASLSYEEASKKYLGKTWTFTHLRPLGPSAKNEAKANACAQAYGITKVGYPTKKRPDLRSTGLLVYFNFGEEILEWIDGTDTDYTGTPLEIEKALPVELDVCTKCDFVEGKPGCEYRSTRLHIAGHMVKMDKQADGQDMILTVLPRGMAY
jgi:hypothetical protein